MNPSPSLDEIKTVLPFIIYPIGVELTQAMDISLHLSIIQYGNDFSSFKYRYRPFFFLLWGMSSPNCIFFRIVSPEGRLAQ